MYSILKESSKYLLGEIYYYLIKKYHEQGNRALIYHAFGSKLKHDTYGISISIANFKAHIDYLRDNYQFKRVHDIADDKLYISISIDDGYKCTIDAIDLLSKYNIPVSLFITVSTLGKDQYLTENDVNEIEMKPSTLKYPKRRVPIGTHKTRNLSTKT